MTLIHYDELHATMRFTHESDDMIMGYYYSDESRLIRTFSKRNEEWCEEAFCEAAH